MNRLFYEQKCINYNSSVILPATVVFLNGFFQPDTELCDNECNVPFQARVPFQAHLPVWDF